MSIFANVLLKSLKKFGIESSSRENLVVVLPPLQWHLLIDNIDFMSFHAGMSNRELHLRRSNPGRPDYSVRSAH